MHFNFQLGIRIYLYHVLTICLLFLGMWEIPMPTLKDVRGGNN